MTIKVLLADDQALVRAGFRSLISRSKDLTVVGEAATGDEAVRLARATEPDVILMDIRMPGMDGIEATRRVLAERPATKVVILTTFDTDEHVFAALRAGASGFLTKEVAPAELRHAVAVVAAGEALLSPSVTRRVVQQFAHRPAPVSGDGLAVLTVREREVVRLVAEGLSNDQIAARLVISPLTAKTHVTRALMKLNVRDRAQLVILAYETGLVQPGA
ncbi:two component transcriptional regulator, LuxR family [Streptosporangium canum]|uniref:Two component transcriptional regulator, LuxR family n=1 Tax=Streptosporangium canum TaxID=324952 RepID=A0A1I3TI42_9ACTN|nr:response regulator transcription factor [Streptosporangium canum]SFJ69301.1 two component transcriptional regulator, LuxR family [Streptosporangium canum]